MTRYVGPDKVNDFGGVERSLVDRVAKETSLTAAPRIVTSDKRPVVAGPDDVITESDTKFTYQRRGDVWTPFPWNTAWGLLGSVASTGTSAMGIPYADPQTDPTAGNMNVSVTLPVRQGRQYLVRGTWNVLINTAGRIWYLIRIGSVFYDCGRVSATVATYWSHTAGVMYAPASTGNVTFSLRCIPFQGLLDAVGYASSTLSEPNSVFVFDMGPTAGSGSAVPYEGVN